jgi:hypothetical protein
MAVRLSTYTEAARQYEFYVLMIIYTNSIFIGLKGPRDQVCKLRFSSVFVKALGCLPI